MKKAGGAVRVIALGAMLSAIPSLSSAGMGGILFAGHPAVPPAVQDFAWRVIETRCRYESHERELRSFWAYDTRATKTDAGTVYSITILSEVPWRKREPPATIEMTIVDDGEVRLTRLKSSFIVCTP